VQRILIIPDTHVPYHSPEALACVLAVARGWKPDGCVILGDWADFHAVSSHPKDPRRTLPFEVEVVEVNGALDDLDKALGRNCWGVYVEGNHETRLERYMIDKAPALLGCVDWRDMLHLDKRGWEVVPYKQSLELGNLRISHDFGKAGLQAARAATQDTGGNAIFGHTHRLMAHYQGQIHGAPHVGMTCGWLGDPEAIDYRHRDAVRRDSIHGFAVVHLLDDGTFWATPVPIVGGRAVVDGVLYAG
jgi:predicted phosphodiesterase